MLPEKKSSSINQSIEYHAKKITIHLWFYLLLILAIVKVNFSLDTKINLCETCKNNNYIRRRKTKEFNAMLNDLHLYISLNTQLKQKHVSLSLELVVFLLVVIIFEGIFILSRFKIKHKKSEFYSLLAPALQTTP